ncbi:MAG TPA: amidohydrolase family protein [Micromonosporaceae bacterium]|nr:amidohydrolase family protein [Micromonosporaceae bacterium]
MTDLVVIAEAGWTGGNRLAGPLGVGVAGRLITWVGPARLAPTTGARRHVDGVLVPGLTDYHVHSALVDLPLLLRGGLTTVVDLGWVPDEIWPAVARSAEPDSGTPRILAAGPFLTATGGYPTRQSWAPAGIAWEIDDPDSAVAAVRALAARHPVTIKVALNADAGPVPDDATLGAIVAQAHACGLTVTAHAQGPGQARRALAAGVHALAHTPWTERLDDSLVAALAARVTCISTIDIHGWGADTAARQTAIDNLRRFRAAGGVVRYGTDLGNGPLPEAVNGREIAALRDAGLTGFDILVAMTRSRLRVGDVADVTTVPGDPLASPSLLARATPVLVSGR